MKTYLFPSLLVFCFAMATACKRPAHLDNADYTATHPERALGEAVPPLVAYTTLDDTLPAKTMAAMKIKNVMGIKVAYASGLYASYFTYEANRQDTLSAIAALPFHRSGIVADTVCRKIAFDHIVLLKTQASSTEIESSHDFWNASEGAYDVYECIKPPLRHILLISKSSHQVLHRIEPFI